MNNTSRTNQHQTTRFQVSLILVLLTIYSAFSMQFKTSDHKPIIVIENEPSGVTISITQRAKEPQKTIKIRLNKHLFIISEKPFIDKHEKESEPTEPAKEFDIPIVVPERKIKKYVPEPIAKLTDRNAQYKGLQEYLFENLYYPVEAEEDEIEDFEVMVSFMVNRDGSIGNIRLEKGESEYNFAEQVLDVVKNMKNWDAAVINGEYKAVKIIIPVIFTTEMEIN